jgi:hypothetical protein
MTALADTNPDCHSDFVTRYVQDFGSIDAAADHFGVSVQALQQRINRICGQ